MTLTAFTRTHVSTCSSLSVICVVFDMTDPATLENAHAWLSDALEANLHLSPLIFLVGTKKDLLVVNNEYKNAART